MILSTFSKKKTFELIKETINKNYGFTGEPTTAIMTGIPSSLFDHSVAITETPANRVEFKVGDCVNLLDIYDDVIVAIAIIISVPKSRQLHNRMQP